jgi:hypothetical protein
MAGTRGTEMAVLLRQVILKMTTIVSEVVKVGAVAISH